MNRLTEYDVYGLPCDEIYMDSSFNCRGQFTVASVADLADSMRGRLHFPIVVQPMEDVPEPERGSGNWRLIAGHRRFVAATLVLKWKEIAARIDHNLTPHQARLLNFTENLERKDLNLLQEAMAIKAMWPDGVSLRAAARELKRDTRWVAGRLKLLTLPEEIQKYAAAGLIGRYDVEALARLESGQLEAARRLVKAKRKGELKPGIDGKPMRMMRRRTKAQINGMITKMFWAGISGLPTLALAWAAGGIDDAELEKEISAYE